MARPTRKRPSRKRPSAPALQFPEPAPFDMGLLVGGLPGTLLGSQLGDTDEGQMFKGLGAGALAQFASKAARSLVTPDGLVDPFASFRADEVGNAVEDSPADALLASAQTRLDLDAVCVACARRGGVVLDEVGVSTGRCGCGAKLGHR